jgi:hypothetical protein
MFKNLFGRNNQFDEANSLVEKDDGGVDDESIAKSIGYEMWCGGKRASRNISGFNLPPHPVSAARKCPTERNLSDPHSALMKLSGVLTSILNEYSYKLHQVSFCRGTYSQHKATGLVSHYNRVLNCLHIIPALQSCPWERKIVPDWSCFSHQNFATL